MIDLYGFGLKLEGKKEATQIDFFMCFFSTVTLPGTIT